MLKTIPREAQAYADLYHGKTLLLKVSGAEINGPDFPELVKDVRDLTKRGVRIILTFGGGEQISQMYGKPREKIDGVGVTTNAVLQEGVLPAYHSIRGKLASAFPDGEIIEPKAVRCDPTENEQLGLVGTPREIVLRDAPLSVVGFVGMSGDTMLNVNADDIAKQLALQERDDIEELILLTSTGGVLNTREKIVSLLTERKLDEILSGTSDAVKVEGGMLKKLQAVREILDVVGKAVITKTDGLQRELLQWMGDGTMCVDTKQLTTSPLQIRERHIFDAIYEQYVRQGIFRPRSAEELERLAQNHHMIRVKKSPLGGFSAVPKGEWVELSAMWSGTIGNGVGRMVMDSALKEVGKRDMYALSTNPEAIAAFRSHKGFTSMGRLSALQASGSIPEHLMSYDTSERDPDIFVKTPGH